MRRNVGGITALLALITFFGGATVGLVALAGWPLPAWSTLRSAIALHSLPSHVVVQLAACVAWPTLVYLLVAVLRLGVDTWNDRPTRVSGPAAWMQPLVRRAIAAVVVLSGLMGRTPAWSAPAPGGTAVASTGLRHVPTGPITDPHAQGSLRRGASVPAPTLTPVATQAQTTYQVKPGDALWDIAQAQLHDPFRWRAIWELNRGRHLVDRDGDEHRFDDPRLIRPGWELLIPAELADPVATSARPSRVLPGLESNATKANRLSRPAPDPPNPDAPPAADATATPAAAGSATATSIAPQLDGPPTMVAVAADRSTDAPGPATFETLAGAGVVGASVLRVIQMLRRRQAQHRPAGRRIRLPGPAGARTERLLRGAQTPDRLALVERATSALAQALRQSSSRPTILGLIVDDDSVEVLLEQPSPATAPWSLGAEGFRWRVRIRDLEDGPSPDTTLLPALVSAGRVAAGSADVLLNLEAAGLIGVAGDPRRAAGFLYALATELVGAPWAVAVNLVLVALPPGLSTRDNVREVQTIREIASELRTTAAVMDATARDRGCSDAFEGRLRGEAGDGWPPTVVLCGRKPSTQETQLLATLAQPGRAVVAVVANAGLVTRWEIDVDAAPCPVHPLRLAIEPTVLDAATLAGIAELFDAAEDDAGAGVDEPPYDSIDISVERATSADRTESPDRTNAAATDRSPPASHCVPVPPGDLPDLGSPAIVVRVLGSVEVEGASEFKRAKSRELVAYLAMHPNGVGESELDEALWGARGGRVVLASTRDSTVSVARTSLGGVTRLLPAQGQGREKRYQLGPDVQSDWGQFCVLHRFGREHRSTAALRQALNLVRGRPFEAVISGRTYGWVHTEGHGRHIEAEVADAADLAAGLLLDEGDPLEARWAARRGLAAEPYTERLWVRLMEAADALGESQEIERLMDEMDVVLELGGDFSSLHPNTLAVYDRLSRRPRIPAAT